ncbi:positive regulator of sigma(E), RseC/MucC [Dethiosulfatibacter aminovorans DSM 17477]|uniref:Positive regulator of sigma(E), RseC/MucC n=1 Tax=Dethiosulfatibacter aminovorans DSM 17477 TaxID=1121476 RepID=A0A1M6D4W4_9FIRM|nr:SoxR reducing system RseC family protein [Dethiosulfatibacter aminovorans]SHI68315.1 positive regulator of sigma(E), RseC/MucC [Dethiosulfatibacter aminovorans DSM 17477]
MEKIAQVVFIENGTAHIKVARASACGDNCASCGSQCTDEGHVLKVKDEGYFPGQLLTVTTKDVNVLLYSMVAYGIPLLVMIIASLLAYNFIAWGNREIVSSAIGVLSLVVSFYILRTVDKKIFKHNDIIESISPYRGE